MALPQLAPQLVAYRSHRARQCSSSRSRRARHADRVSLDAQHLDPRRISPHEPVGGRSSPDTRVVASRYGSDGIRTCMPTRFGGQPHVERHQRKPTHTRRRNSGRTGPQHRPRGRRSNLRWSDGSGVDSVAVHTGPADAADLLCAACRCRSGQHPRRLLDGAVPLGGGGRRAMVCQPSERLGLRLIRLHRGLCRSGLAGRVARRAWRGPPCGADHWHDGAGERDHLRLSA